VTKWTLSLCYPDLQVERRTMNSCEAWQAIAGLPDTVRPAGVTIHADAVAEALGALLAGKPITLPAVFDSTNLTAFTLLGECHG
jgi:hypothetical protein